MNKQVSPVFKLFQTSNNDFYMFDTYANKIKKLSKNCYILNFPSRYFQIKPV